MTGTAMHARKTSLMWAGGAVLAAAVALSAMEGTAVQASPQEYRIAGDHVAVYNLAGAVNVVPGTGSVEASDIRSESVEVDTGSGRITLLAVEAADIMVDTGSGQVELDLAADVDRLEVDTGSGRVTLRVPGDLGARFEADTGSGTIDVEVPIDESTRRRSYVRGTIGDGRGSILVDTGSGSIRVLGR